MCTIQFCIFNQETKRPSKEMQVTIARQLGLEPTTVGNFFMNARRRSMDKWKDDCDPKNSQAVSPNSNHHLDFDDDDDDEMDLDLANDSDDMDSSDHNHHNRSHDSDLLWQQFGDNYDQIMLSGGGGDGGDSFSTANSKYTTNGEIVVVKNRNSVAANHFSAADLDFVEEIRRSNDTNNNETRRNNSFSATNQPSDHVQYNNQRFENHYSGSSHFYQTESSKVL